MADEGLERVGDFLVTHDLPTEAEMADDGGCAAFLADTVRRERPGGPVGRPARERSEPAGTAVPGPRDGAP